MGYLLGHTYPAAPAFGLPCPTTIFTFGILFFTEKNCLVFLLIIPFLWAVIGTFAAIHLGSYEDIGLLSAIVAIPLLPIKG